jgi:hypothetical protein
MLTERTSTDTTLLNRAGVYNPAFFVEHFKKNLGRARVLPIDVGTWPTLSLAEHKSLSALIRKVGYGESAEGDLGEKLAARTADPLDQESLLLYVQEEVRHGKEFFQLAATLHLDVDAVKPGLGGKLTILAGRALNIGRVVDVANLLLLAEVVVLTIYKAVSQHFSHPLVATTFQHIVADESVHIRYHADRVRAELKKGSRRSQIVLKVGHQFALFLVLFSTKLLIGPNIKVLTGLSWSSFLDLVEADYSKIYKGDLLYFRSHWIFQSARFSLVNSFRSNGKFRI